jgi:DNA polymerase-4
MTAGNKPERNILHLDLDAFFVSVERLLHPELMGIPVIIGGESQTNRGVVSACSYEARKFGVHSAMPIVTARKLCPNARFVRGSYAEYGKYSQLVTEVIADQSPLFEKASVDEFYIDLTGMDRYYGCLKWSENLKKKIVKESGLPVSFGLSVNKTVAKIATDYCKPNGQKNVPGAEVLDFLAP